MLMGVVESMPKVRLGFGKRGDAVSVETGFFVMTLVISLAVSAPFIQKTVSDIRGETFEKNYIARDIALMIDALYAAPGDIEFIYSLKSYKFDVELKDSEVFVRKSACDKKEVGGIYAFFGDRKNGLKAVIMPKNKDSVKEMLIVFSKKDGELTLNADGNGEFWNELSEACKKK